MEEINRMMYIDLSKIDKSDKDIVQWVQKAQHHLTVLSSLSSHKERADYLKKHPLWSDLKKYLIDVYGEKCWYSECSIKGSMGDVDHFRPKNESTDETGQVILAEGYWWLAYDYTNYRLSCEKCNRPYASGGKSTCFPLKSGCVPASRPNSIDENILLDPCTEDDCNLIDCNESGAVIAMSFNSYDIMRVETSVRIYNLSLFDTDRKDIRNKCKTALERFQMNYDAKDTANMRYDIDYILSLIDPRTPFSSFAKKYILAKIKDKDYAPVFLKHLT